MNTLTQDVRLLMDNALFEGIEHAMHDRSSPRGKAAVAAALKRLDLWDSIRARIYALEDLVSDLPGVSFCDNCGRLLLPNEPEATLDGSPVCDAACAAAYDRETVADAEDWRRDAQRDDTSPALSGGCV